MSNARVQQAALGCSVFAVVGLSSVAGCGGSDVRAPFPNVTVNDQSADDMGLAAPEEATSGGESSSEGEEASAGEDAGPRPGRVPPPPPVVVLGETTPIEGTTPRLTVVAPRNGATVRTGNVTVRLRLSDWPLSAPTGPHVHLILDDEPYIAVRDVSAPIDLDALVQANLGHELAEGSHVLRFFPSRGPHESVKDAGAFVVVTFHYRRATEGFSFDASAPLLTYSRPKGCNVLGERVLIDFFVTNTTLAPDGARVHWTLDGRSGDITQWLPHWIENLGAGEHSLRLQLVGPDGSPIAGPFNDTTRTFTVAETCG
jgi:hypothetical protein